MCARVCIAVFICLCLVIRTCLLCPGLCFKHVCLNPAKDGLGCGRMVDCSGCKGGINGRASRKERGS